MSATNGDIASGSFTAGKKYLILAMAHFGNTTFNVDTGVKIVHGATAFDDSEQTADASDPPRKRHYFWWTVWTAVGGEDVKFQFRSVTARTATVRFIVSMVANVSDDVTENTDWFFAERSTADAMTTPFLDGASITFTPSTSGHDWLVLTGLQFSSTGFSNILTRRRRQAVFHRLG
jgi:hypothetical protein